MERNYWLIQHIKEAKYEKAHDSQLVLYHPLPKEFDERHATTPTNQIAIERWRTEAFSRDEVIVWCRRGTRDSALRRVSLVTMVAQSRLLVHELLDTRRGHTQDLVSPVGERILAPAYREFTFSGSRVMATWKPLSNTQPILEWIDLSYADIRVILGFHEVTKDGWTEAAKLRLMRSN
eukprot:scaffold2668_cov174-Pinguiococcus_pyrenoidosus.AAC.1